METIKKSTSSFPPIILVASGFLVFAASISLLMLSQLVLVPIVFSIVFAILLQPIARRMEKYGKMNRIWSSTFSLLLALAIVTGVVYFFGSQMANLFSELESFQKNLEKLYHQVLGRVGETVGMKEQEVVKLFSDNSKDIMQKGAGFLGDTLSTGSDFLSFAGLALVFTFLILLYRKSLKHFVLLHFTPQDRRTANKALWDIIDVVKNYFQGVLLVMLIVGTLNFIGLWAIGIEYAFLFGFLGSILTIIPYVGTTIGATLPFLFALVNYPDETWKALAIIPLVFVVQQLEGNLITPKIVGGKVSVNALVAFVALLAGGLIWGIGGMILSIPAAAVIKVICFYVPNMKLYSYFISDEFPDKDYDSYTEESSPVETEQ